MGMWVYIKSEPQLYTVGFYAPDGKFNTDSDWNTKDEAATRVHYLNGGGIDKDKLERIDNAFGYLLDGYKMSATAIYAGLEPMTNENGDYI